MNNIVIHDTAEVIITDLVDGRVVLNAEAQLAGIAGAISEEDLRGGIGNRKLYRIRTDKEITLTMRSALANVEYWAMTQGVTVDEAGTARITAYRTLPVADGAIDVSAIAGEIVPGDDGRTYITVTQANGTQEAVEPTENTVAVTGYNDGDKVNVFYQKEVIGNSISIDSTKFSHKYKVEMRTIAYDVETAQVQSDIYFIFPETIPSGEFDISLENGSVYTPEITFSVVNASGSNEMGQIIEVARTEDETETP